MAFSQIWASIFISIVFLLFLYSFLTTKRGQPINWPLVGMTPTIVLNFHRLHDVYTEILEKTGGTFISKGFWFASRDKLITCDPINAHYILSKNFDNYEKGEEAKKIFDVLGDMLFNADHDEWKKDRKMVRAFFNDPRCIQATVKLVRDSLEHGLLPILDHMSETGKELDLQDLFTRVTLESTCTLVTGYNLGCLSVEFPEIPFAKAMEFANDRVLQRHLVPPMLWKLQRWLNIGEEKKMSEAKKILDDIAAKFIKMKQEDLKLGKVDSFDALKFFMAGDEVSGSSAQPYNVLRDVVVVLNTGGLDTTTSALSWLFWLLSQNPLAISKIREELKSILSMSSYELENGKFRLFSIEELNKLPYFHGAFCEVLRLYPPAPYQQRVAVKSDVLPSGHRVNRNQEVILSWYALGRMKSIWGDDCLEFKPERWISDKGDIKYELANKFLFAFSAGPRVCPGKNDAFTRMKPIAADIVYNYDIKIVDGFAVSAATSIDFRMNNGLLVNVKKKWN